MSKKPIIISGAIGGGIFLYALFFLAFGGEYMSIFGGLLLFLSIFPLAIFILCIVNYNSSASKDARRNLQQNQRFDLLEWYQEECEKANLNDLNSDAKRQKINLIGRKYFGSNFNEEEIKKEITQMKKLLRENQSRAEQYAQEEELALQRKNERHLYETLNRYAEYVGIRKRLKILEDEKQILLANFNNAQMAHNQAKKNEARSYNSSGGDWAINGGMASAIAGPAAGVAAAVNTMRENEEMKQYKTLLIMNAADKKREKEKILEEAGKKLEDCKNEIESTKLKLVSDISDKEVFKSLIADKIATEISETGAVTIEARVSLKEGIEVFGNVKTVVDGSLKAILYANEKVVGEAIMVMPKYGVLYETYVEGICLNPSETNCFYEVRIEPYHLWYMER